MIPFSPRRFRAYRDDLSQAILDLSRERRPEFHELTQDLRNVVEKGRRDPVQPVPNRKHFRHLDEKRQRRTMSDTEGTADTLPIVSIAPAKPADNFKRSITGAGFLGVKIKADIAAAKAKVAAAQHSIGTAVTDIHAAADDGIALAKAIQAEADDLKASFAESSNGGPA